MQEDTLVVNPTRLVSWALAEGQMSDRVAVFIVNYNMPERADALAEYIHWMVKWPHDLYLIDNGSDMKQPSLRTNVLIFPNRQTTGGWLAGLEHADKSGVDYFAYWFLITSAEFPPGDADPLTPMATLLQDDPNAVGVHPALTEDSTTSWRHLITRGGDGPRRTFMIDNIASLYRADWFNSIGRFDPAMKYAWGIDLETCYKARQQGRSLWIDERSRVKKVTNVGYKMQRMGMSASKREKLAGDNMAQVLSERYGPFWWHLMVNANVEEEWR